MTDSPAPRPAKRPEVPWSTRLLAVLGFLLAALVLGFLVSRQVAVANAENYLRKRYGVDIEVPVSQIQPCIVSKARSADRPLPPFGLCWSVRLTVGKREAEVMINPWNDEIVDWRADF
jgi:hypothetical protein